MRKVKRALAVNHGGSDGDHFARLTAAHKRLELGLHSDYDLKLLSDFISELDHNDHIRAGKRLWRNKAGRTSWRGRDADSARRDGVAAAEV